MLSIRFEFDLDLFLSLKVLLTFNIRYFKGELSMSQNKATTPSGKKKIQKLPHKTVVGFLGSGNMAEALIRGIIDTNLTDADKIIAADVSKERLQYISDTYKIETTENIADMAKRADVIFISTKPNQVKDALQSIAKEISSKKLLISIAAGVTIHSIESILKGEIPIIRVMPNTPALVLSGMTAISPGSSAKDEHMKIAHSIFSAVGEAVVVDEGLINAVTAVSGSGPAYIFMIIEAMADGGVRVGLPRDIATKLSAQTVLGAAKMVIETGKHPGQLKDMVASPGGTTIEALSVLEDNGVRGAFIEAVEAAFLRALEMSEE